VRLQPCCPRGRGFAGARYLFLRNHFCSWQVVFGRLEYRYRCTRDAGLKAEIRRFFELVRTRVDTIDAVAGREFSLDRWVGTVVE
jgi:hypothetical protein